MDRRAVLAGLLATGCGASLARFPFDRGGGAAPPEGGLGLELHFFSVCCALVRWPGGAFLIDPFFTHVPLLRVAFGRTLPDPAALSDPAGRFGDVRAVLVGHSHYDHAMGLPLVDPWLADDAQVLGTHTLAHTFAASGLRHPIVGLDGHLASPTDAGTWWRHPSGTLRVLPIRSGHPPQWAFFHLFRRHLDRDRRRPPTRAAHYQEGPTLAFLVDLLDGDRVHARVYVQTSSRGFPDGFPPPAVLGERPVDLAVVSMDVANREQRSGDSILHALQAPVVVFTHYEDFFSPRSRPPREIVKVDLDATRAFFEARDDARYIIPSWDARFAL